MQPPRLKYGGGAPQRLLDSASLDSPSAAARQRAAQLASTASAFSSTAPLRPAAAVARPNVVRTLVTWISVGAAASVALGFAASKLMEQPSSSERRAATPLTELQPTPAPDIAPEVVRPMTRIEPWVPSPAASSAGPDEVAQIEAARGAISRSDFRSAIATLDSYEQTPSGRALQAQASLLRVQAVRESGEVERARALAHDFVARYPNYQLPGGLTQLLQR